MQRVLLIVAAWVAAVSLARATDPATGIDWEVRHRFRVVAEERHDAFIQDFNSYFRRAAERRGLDIPSGQRWFFPSPFQQGLPTHYDPERAQYRHRWFHDDKRVIDVRLARRADRGKRCIWTLDGRQAGVSACGRPARLETVVGRHDLVVKVIGPGAAEEERRLAIEIKDLKFVALGDSFASGEGNPHVTFSENNPRRLAEWWDHRCHRSLLSASAQTAIMMAQQRRDTSITYVSYACSGATIDPGHRRVPTGASSRPRRREIASPSMAARAIAFRTSEASRCRNRSTALASSCAGSRVKALPFSRGSRHPDGLYGGAMNWASARR